MKISDLQRKVAEFVQDNELEAKVKTRLLDLTSELGELAKESLKGSNTKYQKRVEETGEISSGQ